MKTKLAIFDVDGTLFDGNLGIEYIKMLVKMQIFKKEIGENIFQWYEKYKNNEEEKSIVVDEIYKLFSEGMKGLNENLTKKIAKDVWKNVFEKMFKFVPRLLNNIQNDGYLIVLLSGSPIEIISQIGEYLGITNDYIIAGKTEIIHGIYTGKVLSYPGSAIQKIELLDLFIKKNKLEVDWQKSLAMGDNERDIEVLSLVGCPIALNPNKKLKDMAIKNGWRIVSDKNVLSIIEKN